MRKLTILVDMDDTIEGLLDAWLAHLNEKYGLSVVKDSITEWDMQKAYPTLTAEQIYEPLRNAEFWKTVKPYEDAIEYLQALIDGGHEIYIVTSSYYDTVKIKFENVLFKYFPFMPYSHVIITAKKQLVRGDVLIDDYENNLIGGSYWGILFDQPHNRGFDNQKHDIKRVYNWGQVFDLICCLEKE